MAELSFLACLVLTLLLLAVSLFVYKRLQMPAPAPTSQTSTRRTKKRSKKKSGKKSAPADSPAPSPPPSQASAAPVQPAANADKDEASDSESDDGLSAAQVLATRKFKPKSLGGTRLARKIKASLPPADAPRFVVGQQVLARFGGGEEWFPATVLEQRKGNDYHLKYDDGEVEYRVPAEFIKLKPTKSKESGDSDKDDAKVKDAKATEDVRVQEGLSDSDSSQSDDDDGWQMVGTSSAAKRQARRAHAAAPAEVLVDGLTKRQRESRRKKERQREKKELLRQHAQKDDLNARARWRYVPS